MLKKLFIQNFAIIDRLEIDFTNGLSVITGETGAGKSILLGALGMVLGERADSSVIRQKETKCIIEVVFEIKKALNAQEWLKREDLYDGEELILRREIGSNGKSRSFINDIPSGLAQMKDLTSQLVDLHQQFDTLEIGNRDFQRETIDALSHITEDVAEYHQTYLSFIKQEKELASLKEQQEQQSKEQDYIQFLVDELSQVAFREDELETLEQELKWLNNTGSVIQTLQEGIQVLKDGEMPIVQQLKQLLSKMHSYKDLSVTLHQLTDRLESSCIELNDLASELRQLENSLSVDEEKIQLLTERLAEGYRLQKKHQVRTTNELLAVQKELELKLLNFSNLHLQIEQKEADVLQLKQELYKKADWFHSKRKEQCNPFEKRINELLIQVGMPNAQIKIEMQETQPGPYGKDNIHFLFDANKSNRFEPIEKVASGGELSRLMLCIKSLVASVLELPTMIFDEIDTGISGEAALQVGILLKSLSQNHQVITITHLPQIAAKAGTHFHVYKEEEYGHLNTRIQVLQNEKKIEAIARMLSGDKLTTSSLITAKEMISG
ncbi:MAG: DNA repair protein RecN [Lacibacter sp.]